MNNTIYYPQDEMNTFLLQITEGCSYNRCVFCSMYKDNNYSKISLSEIENQLRNGYKYTEKIFLVGADPLSIGFEKMLTILKLIKRHLPYVACVASYASIKNISKYSLKELEILHNEGLRLLYIGFETGDDKVLNFMKKNHNTKDAVEQAKKLNKAKIQFNSIIMYGIAGENNCKENAIKTANMLNQFKKHKIITMNLTVFHGTELDRKVIYGEFKIPSRIERLNEIKILLEEINKEEVQFDTTHPTNIIKIKGIIPVDREKLIYKVENEIKRCM